MRIIRVFPRKTSMTPGDTYAFVGDPPLWRPEANEVHVSVAFTWDTEEGQRLAEAWGNHYETVKLGGPAFGDSKGNFEPGVYLKHGVTITSRGCPNKCPWCLVPKYEGELRVLPIRPGWIVQDNNLLATPHNHQAAVFEMLKAQGRRVSFPGGLDARLLTPWAVEQLRSLPIREAFFAADSKGMISVVANVRKQLDFLSRRQLRCYVLIAYGDESIAEAKKRLEAVWRAGYLPFAQLFQPPDRWLNYSQPWKALARTWSRPAAMFAMHKGGREHDKV